MYKLIALDMDGTLLKDNKTISKENFDALKKARENNIKIVLATGRPIKGIEKYLKELDLIGEDEYAVTFNGAMVKTTKGDHIVAQTVMTLEDLDYLYKLSKKLEVNIHAHTNEECITPKPSKYSILEADLNSIPLTQVDFDNIDKNTIIVKIMFIDEPEILDRVIQALPKDLYEKYTILRSTPYFLEFLNKESNKGTGVKLLSEKLGIKREEIICAGDADNDKHMIEYAGLGVAMANADDDVKKIANFVTKSNEDNGIAYVINKFVFDK
ncbi:HAD family hydrolase [Clostridium pasteurianum DSM 525 = ATCC 6013]|uniref:Cof-like hydrolase n=1 Tax=Clostridium pasteurianum DSM 525 = ATCC 6013 TaxID=1262449 RepID=A0A0H3J611_CLOPA|nr:sugar-phosphatase [Clostridium pasteurianum]AJA47343.1 HAD family hydrolase [Clostridium pasteurianum DSM 525 = ATCC 6013]AJA51331.1 HAD family hydrolase [Clostridium pasteurianum DSM 525 = ATCC 6013]AOZ74678.1 HAD family hydrolase [Clostridium pasteurianum DSM 525 = ATCC 6013]AOZ78475.1 HAD family hydrolase [Clostridium pasteurianum]ELP58682.1 HAD family hydrolase [Clostridium pasteurianum DSM 525 = ATCC 6013]